QGDWSSDVCSSDLGFVAPDERPPRTRRARNPNRPFEDPPTLACRSRLLLMRTEKLSSQPTALCKSPRWQGKRRKRLRSIQKNMCGDKLDLISRETLGATAKILAWLQNTIRPRAK